MYSSRKPATCYLQHFFNLQHYLTLDNTQGDVLWFLKVLKVGLKFYFICLSLGRGTSRGHLPWISRFHYNHLNPASCYHTGCFDCIVLHFCSPASQQQDKRYLLLSSILHNIWFPKLWFNGRTKWWFWKYVENNKTDINGFSFPETHHLLGNHSLVWS